VVNEFSIGITPGAQPSGITAGPDGNLWFTEVAANRIGQITPLGVVTEFSAGISPGAQPVAIAAGHDGNLWFTENGGDRIGRITPLGVVNEFSAGITPGAFLFGIASGPDHNLWFAEDGGNRIGRITVGSNYYTLTPCRVADTRNPSGPYGGPALAANADRSFVLVNQCGIPASAVAVSSNITITQPTSLGDLRLFPGGSSLPLVSTLNWRAGQTRANNAILSLGLSGAIVVHVDQAGGTVQFILDVDGYFQ
jgi:hypothetical protein